MVVGPWSLVPGRWSLVCWSGECLVVAFEYCDGLTEVGP